MNLASDLSNYDTFALVSYTQSDKTMKKPDLHDYVDVKNQELFDDIPDGAIEITDKFPSATPRSEILQAIDRSVIKNKQPTYFLWDDFFPLVATWRDDLFGLENSEKTKDAFWRLARFRRSSKYKEYDKAMNEYRLNLESAVEANNILRWMVNNLQEQTRKTLLETLDDTAVHEYGYADALPIVVAANDALIKALDVDISALDTKEG